jgi:hypothetical protein
MRIEESQEKPKESPHQYLYMANPHTDYYSEKKNRKLPNLSSLADGDN